MKKIKELLLFLAFLIIPFVLFFVISGFTADLISDLPSFVGVVNYIRMFSNDKIFLKSLLNTLLKPAIVSFLLVFVFAVIVFLVRKKIKVRRWVFYLGSVFIGSVTTLFYTAYLGILSFHTSSNLYAAQQTLISHILDYRPSVNVITFQNVLFSMCIGILTAFVFWILELICYIIKLIKYKRQNVTKIL